MCGKFALCVLVKPNKNGEHDKSYRLTYFQTQIYFPLSCTLYLGLCILKDVKINGVIFNEFRCLVDLTKSFEPESPYLESSVLGTDLLQCCNGRVIDGVFKVESFNLYRYICMLCYDSYFRTLFTHLLSGRISTIYGFDICYIPS